MNTVIWTRNAEKQFNKCPLKIKAQILAGIDRLAETWPNSVNVKDLVDMPGYRLRIGAYRIFFLATDDGRMTVLQITQVRKRDDQTYKH